MDERSCYVFKHHPVSGHSFLDYGWSPDPSEPIRLTPKNCEDRKMGLSLGGLTEASMVQEQLAITICYVIEEKR